MNQEEEKNETIIKPLITKELAALYDVCPKTFRKWISPFKEAIGKREGNYFSVKQVKIIFDKLDLPSKLAA